MRINRRQILHSATAASLLAALPKALLAAQAARPEWLVLAEGLALVRGAGGNVLVNWGHDGVALVDGGHADAADALLALVADRAGAQPELLFNTHCHRDQTGCNLRLGEQGATIVAHENTRLWLGTEIISRWEGRSYPPLPIQAQPGSTFIYDTQRLDFNEPLEYGVLPQAHTDGDIYVYFSERNILFAGGVVSPDAYPLIDYSTNGWIGGMVDGLSQLLDICNAQTRIFASTGGEVSRDELVAQRDMLLNILEKIASNYYSGGTFQEFLATAPTAEFDARYGDPSLFLYTAYQSVWGHTGEVRRYRAAR